MGIPHLISTLEPYATHGRLDGLPVVIDGPAFAYHVLYICNRHGLAQPSYKLLGDTALAWLHELSKRHVEIGAIYFDGYLPLAKRPVRVGRMAKSQHQLTTVYSSNPNGFAPNYLASPKTATASSMPLFSSACPTGKPFPPPSFLVPTIIDSLHNSSRYADLVHLISGEADVYCAQHVRNSGGTVLSSDSDLLVHDLGQGQVAFLRGICLDSDSAITCTSFSPAAIAKRLGLSFPEGFRRFAYERMCCSQSSLSGLLKDTGKPVADEYGYNEFCREYIPHDHATLSISTCGSDLSIHLLDPRFSELVLQLHLDGANTKEERPTMYLPILVESPERGSAWEQTTPIRQLAYTLVQQIIDRPSTSSVLEYRRVNNPIQRGREVQALTMTEISDLCNDLVSLMDLVQQRTGGDVQLTWYLFCLSVDIRHCYELGKRSHALGILQAGSQTLKSQKVSWDLIHFSAQLQACSYSFRILHQVLSLSPTRLATTGLQAALSLLPPLTAYPDIEKTVCFLKGAADLGVLEMVAQLVPIPEHDQHLSTARPQSKQKARGRRSPSATKTLAHPNYKPQNPFDVLSQD